MSYLMNGSVRPDLEEAIFHRADAIVACQVEFMDPGIGTGIGQGLASIGQSLSRKYEIEAFAGLQQRDKRADLLLYQLQNQAAEVAPLSGEYQQLSQIVEGQRSPQQQQRLQQLTERLTKAQQERQSWTQELHGLYQQPDGSHDTRGLFEKLKGAFSGTPRRRRVETISPPGTAEPGAPPQGAPPGQAPPLSDFLSGLPHKALPVTTWEKDTDAPIPFSARGGVVYRPEVNRSTGERRWAPVAGATPFDIESETVRQQRAAGLSTEDIQKAERIHSGLEPRAVGASERWVPITGTLNGQRVTLLRNAAGEFHDLNHDPVDPTGFIQQTGAAPRPRLMWTKEGNNFVNFLADPFTNQEIPGSRNPNAQPPASMLPLIREGFIHYVDDQNNMVVLPVTSTSQRAPAPTGAAPPATPGEAKDRIQTVAPKPGVGAPQVVGKARLPAAIQTRIDQANTVKLAGQQLIAEIRAARDRLGAYKGRIGSIEVGLGTADPVLRKLYTDMKSFAALQPALHGARGVGMQREFETASAQLKDNPESGIAAIQGLIDRADDFIQGFSQQGTETPQTPTGMIKVWSGVPGQKDGEIDPEQWEAFKKKFPNAVRR